ncbi:MAG TPA: hypothetical protein VFZ78_08265 [Flavisolibacter sp.]
MQKITIKNNLPAGAILKTGRPAIPASSRQPVSERKTMDPSSAFTKGQGYPIPAFFEYRIKPRDFDPL